jgi:hypothetical protein
MRGWRCPVTADALPALSPEEKQLAAKHKNFVRKKLWLRVRHSAA